MPGERSFWNQLGPFIECGNNQLAKPYAAGPAQPGVLSACACLSKLGRMEEQGPIGARMTFKQSCATMDNFHGKNAQAQWRRHRAVTRPPTIAGRRIHTRVAILLRGVCDWSRVIDVPVASPTIHQGNQHKNGAVSEIDNPP